MSQLRVAQCRWESYNMSYTLLPGTHGTLSKEVQALLLDQGPGQGTRFCFWGPTQVWHTVTVSRPCSGREALVLCSLCLG